MNNLNAKVEDYTAKEIAYLRGGIDEAIKETRSLERYSLLVTGAIWSWCAAADGDDGLKLIIWFPFFLITLFGLRSWGISKEIIAIDQYLGRVEDMIGLPAWIGWERNQAENRSPVEVKTAYLFWGILQFGAVLVAVLYDLDFLSEISKK